MHRTIIALLLIISMRAGATHWLTYYIYLETEYVQGPWARTNLLARSDYKYLAPKVYEDLFGTMKEDLAEKFMDRLREEKPEVYDWDFQLSLHGDTVWLEYEAGIDHLETVMNEVTATMIMNSFDAVCFKDPDGAMTYALTDLTLPLFDLVSLSKKDAPENGKKRAMEHKASQSKNPLLIWLIVSVVLNLVLGLWIILRSER